MTTLPARSATAVAVLALSLCAFGCGVSGDRVLATVGDRKITVSEFEAAARQRPYLALDPSPESKRALLDDLVERALLASEARRRGLANATELAGIRREARETALQEMLYEQVITDRVRATPAEAKALWEDQDEQWRVSQIFCFSELQAREAEKQLRLGRPFAEVALHYSQDTPSAVQGGDIGEVTAGQLPAQIERAVRETKVGGWAGPMHTPIGWYFVQVTERIPRERASFDESREAIENLLVQRKSRALVLSYIARLKKKAHLRLEPEGLQLLSQKWQNKTPDELFAAAGDPKLLGFTDAELQQPLVVFDGGTYTVRDFFADAGKDLPPSSQDTLLRLYLEDRATARLLTREAERFGLDRDPGAAQRLRDREESHLITLAYENIVVPAATLTPAEREEIAAQGTIGADPASRTQAVAELEARRYEAKRQTVLRDLLATVKEREKPYIDERALEAVPWPVPPKESA